MQTVSEKTWLAIIGGISVLVIVIVGLLLVQSQGMSAPVSEQIYLLPELNAYINTLTFICLVAGFIAIKKRHFKVHQSFMVTAFMLSVLFLVSYLTYHYGSPHTSYGGSGILAYTYYFILITHILLAIVIVPLALVTVFRAWRMDYNKHKKIAKWTLPIWLYVSATGVVVYLMISPYYPV